MPRSSTPSPFSPLALLRQLAWLRLCGVIGQTVAVMVALRWLDVAVPLHPLTIEIAAMAAFAGLVFWRLRVGFRAGEAEAVAHILVDTLLFGVAIHFTGGASNPFINLLLVPVALGAAALSLRGTAAVLAIVVSAYLLLLYHYHPLPGEAMAGDRMFREHVVGMAVNFVLAAALLAFFVGRLGAAVRHQGEIVRRVRERALRGEGILAVATQAAGTAHELNTPLASMRLLVGEMRREHSDDAGLGADLSLLESQVDRCSGILHEMAAFGREQLAETTAARRVGELVADVIERLQLLRPQVRVTTRVDEVLAGRELAVPGGLRHALLNLLDNAADASASAGSDAVRLTVDGDARSLILEIGDDGPGLADVDLVSFGASDKHDGLGLGLALAAATAERLGGEITSRRDADGNLIVLRLPWSRLTPT